MCSNSDFFLARNIISQKPEYSNEFKKRVIEGKEPIKNVNKDFLMYIANEKIKKTIGVSII